MALHTITSEPRPSIRHHGWHFAYYDKATPSGRQCVVTFPASIADTIRPGFKFDEATSVRWDDALKASVLHLDFHELEGLVEPALPPDPESGWGDPDYPAPSSHIQQPKLSSPEPAAAPRPMRAPAHRRAEARQAAEQGAQLPAAYLKINREVAQSFLFQLRMIGNAVGEQRRADVAQKLCAIASIPYYRQIGVELTEDDIKGMTAL